ncbi:MAG TPA: hypothetical protein VNE63_24310 [Candidatus Acidoferrales bacterium]|nr:hypothetical protein [Candidatus Acidoferrales bacterium]
MRERGTDTFDIGNDEPMTGVKAVPRMEGEIPCSPACATGLMPVLIRVRLSERIVQLNSTLSQDAE